LQRLAQAGLQWIPGLTLEHFKALKLDELKAFIYVRKYKRGDTTKAINGNKGTLEQARAGQRTVLLQAFEMRAETVKAEALTHEALKEAEAMWREEEMAKSFFDSSDVTLMKAALHDVTAVQRPCADTRKASDILLAQGWAEQFQACLTGSVHRTMDASTANALQDALAKRLPFCAKRAGPDKQGHWVFDFVRDNIPVLAAMITCAGHAKDRIRHFGDNESLLKDMASTTHFVEYSASAHADHQGAYLFWDRERGFIRSGKADVLGHRKKAHDEGAASSSPKLEFYRLYPTKSVVEKRGIDALIRGVYEDLTMFLALTWEPKRSAELVAMFTWHPDIIQRFELSKKSCASRTEIKAGLITYLIELAYDLLLSRANNVSKNPGFEKHLQVFDKHRMD
jgi:hypothetical protein